MSHVHVVALGEHVVVHVACGEVEGAVEGLGRALREDIPAPVNASHTGIGTSDNSSIVC